MTRTEQPQPSMSSSTQSSEPSPRNTRRLETNPASIFYWIIQILCGPVTWFFRWSRRLGQDNDEGCFQTLLNEACEGAARVPQVMQCNYKTAVARSVEDSSKFLLLYLHSPIHQDTPRFCQQILGSEVMTDFIAERFHFWGASVETVEGYALSLQLGAASFPFLALVSTTTSQSSVHLIWKLDHLVPLEVYLDRLSRVTRANEAQLAEVRRVQVERASDALLRAEQDREYQEALARDQSRARAEAEAKAEAQVQVEAEAQARIQERRDMEALVEKFKVETQPSSSSSEACTHIRFQMADGSRFERVFRRQDSLAHVRDFVRAELFRRNVGLKRFELATNFPRRAWGPREHDDDETQDMTLSEAELVPRAVLYVQDLDS